MGPKSKKNSLVKNDGQVFTPEYIVNNILDLSGYSGKTIIKKHIIDNSCGDGAFLREILKRYLSVSKQLDIPSNDIKIQLETYLHGIELDPVAYNSCIEKMSKIASDAGINDVKWDIINDSSIKVTKHNHKMDFVVGNPPYVRVHNLNESYDDVKSFSFAEGGMTDLYLVFFEIGFNMLNKGGVLCYITPSSWLSSLAGNVMRKYIRTHKTLSAVVDLGHYQAFNATAYTMISLFEESKHNNIFDYYTFDGESRCNVFVSSLNLNDVDIAGNFYLAKQNTLHELKRIKCGQYPKHVCVKNGFATLADKVFIGDVPDTSITIPIIKGSTGKWAKCLYPYDKSGKPIPESTLFSESAIRDYFFSHKAELVKDHPDMKGWFYFGRTQALNDVQKMKYAINTIIKDVESIKFNPVPAGSGIYSGLYILTDVEQEIIEKIIKSVEFITYISALKSYKSGGYYTFNTKDLEQYINFKLSELHYEKTERANSVEQHGIFEGCLELF